MGTRCVIRIGGYQIYRHSDGYPEGVISDLYLFSRNYSRSPLEDPEYFLANFIFYCKLSFWLTDINFRDCKGWEYTYGVCSSRCRHDDLDYIYEFDKDGRLRIYEFDYDGEEAVKREIFRGTLLQAYLEFCLNSPYKDGCHLNVKVFNIPKSIIESINKSIEVLGEVTV